MDRHRDIVPHGLQAPDHLIEILPAEDLPRVAHEKEQQLILLVLQGQLPAVFEDQPLLRVGRQGADGQALLSA